MMLYCLIGKCCWQLLLQWEVVARFATWADPVLFSLLLYLLLVFAGSAHLHALLVDPL